MITRWPTARSAASSSALAAVAFSCSTPATKRNFGTRCALKVFRKCVSASTSKAPKSCRRIKMRAVLPVALLAGGLATRLRPITEKIPKLLVEVAGEPFFTHQLRLLKTAGLTRLVLCVGYLGEKIVGLYGDGSKWNVSIEYVFDGPKLLGT